MIFLVVGLKNEEDLEESGLVWWIESGTKRSGIIQRQQTVPLYNRCGDPDGPMVTA